VALTALQIKEMANEFVQRAVSHGTGDKLVKEMAESEKLVAEERDQLFPGIFFSNDTNPRRMVDAEDGVLRCIRCNWEVTPPGWRDSNVRSRGRSARTVDLTSRTTTRV
jgi:hypothetical protein